MKHTEETKRSIGDLSRGVKRPPFSEEHRAKIAAARLGTSASEGARRKMADSQRRRYEQVKPLLLNGEPVNLQQLADLAGCTRGAMQQRIRTMKLTPERAVAMGRSMTRLEALAYGKSANSITAEVGPVPAKQ